jgi:hypothetical protein
LSEIPEELADYGSTKKTKPRQNPAFKPGAGFGTEDYYVWSRCDGSSSVYDIILMVGLGASRSIEILRKLREMGAVLLPGESRPPPVIHENLMARQNGGEMPPPKPKRPQQELGTPVASAVAEFSDLPPTVSVPMGVVSSDTQSSNRPAPRVHKAARAPLAEPKVQGPPAAILTLTNPSQEESAALALDITLTEQERIRILLFRRRLGRSNLFELLEVETETDKRNVKRAYFRLSKDFHPDLHYGKDIGPFEGWLSEVFKAITDAFKILGNNKKRAKYESSLRGDAGHDLPQTKEDHALALFQNACDSELHGETEQALKLFAAAIRMDEQPRYMRRAAMCAVQARELSVAEEYAKKAAELFKKDASYQRVLADVYRAGAQYEMAKGILEQSLTLNIENDTLFGELESDLASVNAAIAEALADS